MRYLTCVLTPAILLLAQLALAAGPSASATPVEPPRQIGSQRELFVDDYLIQDLKNARLVLHRPVDRGPVMMLDRPWEGQFSGYFTVIKDGDLYRMYYRGRPAAGADGTLGEVTCYAESTDGIHWIKPNLGLVEIAGSKENNVILASVPPYNHNFSPMLDTRPGVSPGERYKALAGSHKSGLVAFVSADGVRWRKLQSEPVITGGAFDSQNVCFWADAEQCYLCYFRVFKDGFRRIARTTSKDFLHWTPSVMMEYQRHGAPVPIEHLYTNQTHPYFRAPQIYVATAARFMPGRQAITDEEAKAIQVHPSYYKDVSDSVLLTSRGGDRYDRTFMEGFVCPGFGAENWVSRTNYPVLNLVPTGPAEMSLYVNQNYGQPTAHVRRYTLRLDGFASVEASYDGGELVTRPLVFHGKQLLLNYATSAAGGIRVEIQDAEGMPISGFQLADAQERIGNRIEQATQWKAGTDLGHLAGQPVRLRFVMKDANLFALRFQ